MPAEGGEPTALGPGALHHVQVIGPREIIGDSGQGGSSTLLQHLTFGVSRSSRTLVSEPALDPQLSPDKKWLAYDRYAGESRAVFLQSWPDGKLTIPVPDGAGWCPRWRADGKELFLLRPNGTLAALAVIDKGDRLDFGPVTTLQPGTMHQRFAVSPDGQTFAFGSQGDGRETSATVHVILNWRGGK